MEQSHHIIRVFQILPLPHHVTQKLPKLPQFDSIVRAIAPKRPDTVLGFTADEKL
jgi:hypothetical protein